MPHERVRLHYCLRYRWGIDDILRNVDRDAYYFAVNEPIK